MPHLVTSAQTDPHVLSSNDARLMAGIYGNGSYVLPVCNRMAATMVNTNTLRILDGDALTCGRHWAIDDAYEEYDVENGTPGMKRIDLVVARIKTAPVETIEIVVIKGEEIASNPVIPGYVEGDLNAGDTVTEMPLYAIPIDGINPGEPVPKFTVSESMTQAWDSLSRANAESWARINSGGSYERHFIGRGGKEYMLVVDVEYGGMEIHNVTDDKRIMRLP